MSNVGKHIQMIRTAKSMTQEELAEKLYVTHQTVSNYERGKTRPDVDTLIRIAGILEVDVTDLIYGPPSLEDRRRAILRSLTLLAATVFLGFLISQAKNALLNYVQNTFRTAPLWLMRMMIVPAWFLLAGWSLMYAAETLLRIPAPKGKHIPRLHILLTVLVCAWYILLLPGCTLILLNNFGIIHRTVYFNVIPVWDWIAARLAVFALSDNLWLFLLPGMALRLTKRRRSDNV